MTVLKGFVRASLLRILLEPNPQAPHAMTAFSSTRVAEVLDYLSVRANHRIFQYRDPCIYRTVS